jgi:cytosine/adenosine deaminase-related metal-dependent hydrolase
MTSKRRTEREFMQIKYLGYTRVADKTRQRGGNQVFIPAIIEAHSHFCSRTIDLFE